MGLGVVLLAVAIFAGVFFLILSCGRLFEWCCGDQGSFNGEKLVTGKRYGTRNIYARLQRTEADRAVAEALHWPWALVASALALPLASERLKAAMVCVRWNLPATILAVECR